MIVYTAIYGGYDFLHPHPDIEGVEWRCYTDGHWVLDSNGWDIVTEPARYPHPRMAAKYRKCHPPLDHSESLWVDGCVQITDASFVDQFSDDLLTLEHPIALWRHPQRTRIDDEARFSTGLPKYRGLDMVGQVERLMLRKPNALDLGLWASTVIGRIHTQEVLQFGAAWLAHCELETYQDQLSLPVILDDYGLEPAVIPGALTGAPGFAWHWGDHRSQM